MEIKNEAELLNKFCDKNEFRKITKNAIFQHDI